MPRLPEQLVVVIGLQSGETVVNTDVQNSTIVANTDDGAALSPGEALGISIRDDSITFDLSRIAEEGQTVPGSLSIGASTFNRVDAGLAFDTTLKGSGVATPASPGDYNLPEAIEDLLEIAGLIRGSETGTDTTYNLGDPNFATIKVWRGDQSWTLVDCRNTPGFAFTPGEATVVTHTISVGQVIHNTSDTFPVSIDFGVQLSLKSPILRQAASVIGAETRDWTDLVVDLANNFAEFPAANSLTGVVNELEGRLVEINGNFFVDSAGDEDQDFQNLSLEVPPVDDIDFINGESAADPANSVRFQVKNVDFTVNGTVQTAGRIVWNLQGNATSTAGDDEFVLISE